MTRIISLQIVNYLHILFMEKTIDLKYCAERWGLCSDYIQDLGQRLIDFKERYRDCLTNRYHDTSEHALTYLKGLVFLPNKRTYKEIARSIEGPKSDGQNLQNYMSDSPWSGSGVFDRIQSEIIEDKRLHGGALSLDERGERCFGTCKAGAGRQYIGNIGKVDLGQVGVALGFYTSCLSEPQILDLWTLVDAELFFPESWFEGEYEKRFKRLHIPADRVFKTKPQIGLDLIDRAIANELPFTRVSCDCLYGRNHNLRWELEERNLLYLADIPVNMRLYVEKPVTGIPSKPTGAKGRKPSKWKVLNGVKPLKAHQIAKRLEATFQPVDIRPCERGRLIYECAAQKVWTITSKGEVRAERLFVRKETDGSRTYSLTNADEQTSLKTLAQWRSERFFVERTFEDGNGEIGWDELEAQKYRAWMHHAALTGLALWFMAQTKLDWALAHPKDDTLAAELGVDKLPQISTANIKRLLQIVMPIKQPSLEEVIDIIVHFLVERAESTACRMRKQKRKPAPI